MNELWLCIVLAVAGFALVRVIGAEWDKLRAPDPLEPVPYSQLADDFEGEQ